MLIFGTAVISSYQVDLHAQLPQARVLRVPNFNTGIPNERRILLRDAWITHVYVKDETNEALKNSLLLSAHRHTVQFAAGDDNQHELVTVKR